MRAIASFGVALVAGMAAFTPLSARAATVCSTVEEFNAYMADNATYSEDVTLTFDVGGVNPSDFHNSKGSLGHFRNTLCQSGHQDSVIKVYGTADTFNSSHPPGTLKMEYGNKCCGQSSCGEKWADPNASAEIFKDGTEQCNVTMWTKPDSIGYKLVCGANTYDGLGDNDQKNVVNNIAVLNYLLPDGGDTWTMDKATATNVKVCYVTTGTPVQSQTITVVEDVTTGPSYPNSVFPDVGDLAVEAGDHQAWLKFVVPPVGKITKATLFMHTRTESYSNGAGGEVYTVSDNSWSETTLNWSNKPAIGTTSLGRIGPASADQTVSLDVTSAITKPGTYGFAVVSPVTDTNGTHFFSKEGSSTNAPSLKISFDTVDADGDGTPDGPDCNDADATVNPTATEQCNGKDDNCDGQSDEGCPGGGSGGNGTGGGWTGGGAGIGGSGLDPNAENDDGDTGGGCGCSVPRSSDRGWLAAALGALFLVARRRRAPLQG